MLSVEAIKRDTESGYTLIPMNEIYADPEFNCRGAFRADDIIELAKDVAARGLIEAVIVRPLWENEIEITKKGYKYSLVAGFRRFSAYKVNDAEKIPASIRKIVSDFDCRDVNAVENLQRKDLTLYQEARSIKHYWLADWPRDEIAIRVSKSPGWVQVRCMLLEMEPEIQQAADQGYLLQSDIRELYKYKGAERLKRAGLVRDARKSGQTKNIVDKIKKKAKASSKKRRTEYEIQELMEYIRIHFERVDPEETMVLSDFISPQGNSIIHRVMAWVSGTITSLDVHMSLRDFCRKMGIEYTLPEFEPEKL